MLGTEPLATKPLSTQGAAGVFTLIPLLAALLFSGQSVSVNHNRAITPGAGTLTVSGQSVTVTHGRLLTPTAAALALSGQSVVFTHGRLTTPTAGALTLAVLLAQELVTRNFQVVMDPQVAKEHLLAAAAAGLAQQPMVVTPADQQAVTVVPRAAEQAAMEIREPALTQEVPATSLAAAAAAAAIQTKWAEPEQEARSELLIKTPETFLRFFK